MRGLEERLDVEDERGKGGANNEVLIASRVLDGNGICKGQLVCWRRK